MCQQYIENTQILALRRALAERQGAQAQLRGTQAEIGERVAEFDRTTSADLPHTIGCPWSTLCGVHTLIYQAIVMSEHPDKVWPRNEDWGAFYPMMLREKWEKASLEVRDVLQQLAKEHNFNIDGFVVDISEGFLGGLLPEGRLAGVV